MAMGGAPSWMQVGFENGNLELARCFALSLLDGKPHTRITLSECYYSPPVRSERKEVSEMWIDLLWSRIEGFSSRDWCHAAGSRKSFVGFVYGFWGKDI